MVVQGIQNIEKSKIAEADAASLSIACGNVLASSYV